MTVMRTTTTVVFALAIASCGGKKKDGAGAGTGTGATPSGADAASAEAPLPPPTPVDQAAVRKVIDAWLAAQNADDFAAYDALYAAKMEGVKRVGARTKRFDRAGWMADRKKMFDGKPMTVAARDVTIGGSATAPTVELVQTFAQGRFSDEGPKRFVLAKAATGFQIAREEMVASTVGAPVAMGADAIGLVLEIDGRYHLVVKPEADVAWASGRITGPFDGMHKYALRTAAAAPMAAEWASKAVTVYDAGKSCPATVGTLRLVGGGTPHFGEVQLWDDDEGRTWTPAERARAIYDMGDHYLIGELAVTGDCKPQYATAATAKITVATSADLDDATEAAAVKKFRALTAYKDIQTFFTDDGGSGEWAPSPAVEGYDLGGKRYVVVGASEGDGCGAFEGALTAIYAIDGANLTLLSNPADGYVDVDALVDSDGDGKPELIGRTPDFSTVVAHFMPIAGGFAATNVVTFPFNDCGC